MAVDVTVRPGEWNEMFGIWFYVWPDPLAGAEKVRVTVHRTGHALWFRTAGACAGVHFQTTAPDTSEERL